MQLLDLDLDNLLFLLLLYSYQLLKHCLLHSQEVHSPIIAFPKKYAFSLKLLFYFLLSSPYLDRHEGCNSCPFVQLHRQVYQCFVLVLLMQCTQHLSKFYDMQLLNSFEAFTTKFLPLSGSRTFSTRFGARRPRRPGFPASQTHPVKSKFKFSKPVLPNLTFLGHK